MFPSRNQTSDPENSWFIWRALIEFRVAHTVFLNYYIILDSDGDSHDKCSLPHETHQGLHHYRPRQHDF